MSTCSAWFGLVAARAQGLDVDVVIPNEVAWVEHCQLCVCMCICMHACACTCACVWVEHCHLKRVDHTTLGTLEAVSAVVPRDDLRARSG